jgi:hypothetical protein
MNEGRKKKSTKEKKGRSHGSPKSPDPSPPFQRVRQNSGFNFPDVHNLNFLWQETEQILQYLKDENIDLKAYTDHLRDESQELQSEIRKLQVCKRVS